MRRGVGWFAGGVVLLAGMGLGALITVGIGQASPPERDERGFIHEARNNFFHNGVNPLRSEPAHLILAEGYQACRWLETQPADPPYKPHFDVVTDPFTEGKMMRRYVSESKSSRFVKLHRGGRLALTLAAWSQLCPELDNRLHWYPTDD